ncbi:hypothetical protein PIROE2DRAFT_15308 [Piromyces sp. E2]|nr:hypothetical protein PIROE2DRAFT_15308 [Piromyces sp. E2]|eukprot:OUM59217.1 hypothetical protein PIROE2DRAFT_15308 [Piromyces sp. E2]
MDHEVEQDEEKEDKERRKVVIEQSPKNDKGKEPIVEGDQSDYEEMRDIEMIDEININDSNNSNESVHNASKETKGIIL